MSFGLGFGFPGTASSGGATLALQFAGATALDPRITFTRASSATYFNAAGVLTSATNDAPRLDYNPTTLAAQGLLIEEQRTNLLTYSEQFDNAAWTKTNSIVSANVTTSPDGNVNAELFIPNTTNADHSTSQLAIATAVLGSPYSLSVFAKAGGYNFVRLSFGGPAGGGFTFFNLATGVIGTSSGQLSSGITAVGNGWYRCTITRNAGSAAGLNSDIYVTSADNQFSWSGDGVSGIYFYGAQLEVGAFATSYIPTVAAQATRAADVASMTGTNFSSWYNQTEGTLYAEYQGPAVLNNSGSSTINGVVMATNPINTNLSAIFLHPSLLGKGSQNMLENNVNPGRLDAGGAYSTAVAKAAAAFVTSNRAISVNGGVVVTSATGTVPTGVDRLHLGWQSITVGVNMLNGYIRNIAYYPRRLSNAELQAITT